MNTFLILSIILLIIAFLFKEVIKINLLNILVVLRGIITTNCNWYKISDILLKDSSGIDLYNYYQKKNDFTPMKMFGQKIYLVTNIKYIKIILDNSPDLFNVGLLKKKFFKSIMSKNVGVSSGCPWKNRRLINEFALDTGKIPKYADIYNYNIKKIIMIYNKKTHFKLIDFKNIGKIIVLNIVFGTSDINDNIFSIFSEANSIKALLHDNFRIDDNILKSFTNTLYYYINNPQKYSLIESMKMINGNKIELFHQIPHFLFPLLGLFITTIPRLLVLLYNHQEILDKVLNEIDSVDYKNDTSQNKIYKLIFLRKCILETLRLNNPVVTTFRTLTTDYNFDEKYKFEKNTQFLILNNAVLRDDKFFKYPNKFIPSRWNSEIEKTYYAISFNQGPQKCPGKEFSIFLIQSFIYNFFKIMGIGKNHKIITNSINKKYIPQAINPCSISIKIL